MPLAVNFDPDQAMLDRLPSTVEKRCGTLHYFDPSKIDRAITSAFGDVYSGSSGDAYPILVRAVVISALNSLYLEESPVSIHIIERHVLTVLRDLQLFDVANAYQSWKIGRQHLRDQRAPAMPKKALSDYIHISKYANYLPSKKRRETRYESVSRVEKMFLDDYPDLSKDIKKSISFLHQQQVLCSMRTLQFAGPAIQANNGRGYNCIASYIDHPRRFSEIFHWLLCGSGVGFSIQLQHVSKLPSLASRDLYVSNPTSIYVVEDSIEGWAKAFDALIFSYIKGHPVSFDYTEIRKRNERLHTSGGRAPGAGPLMRALQRIAVLLEDASGRQLRPLECMDILCHAADAVRAGGVRRSAMLALFDAWDEDVLLSKTGRWDLIAPWRGRVNISAALHRELITREQYDRVVALSKEWGEPGLWWLNDFNALTNPCGELGAWAILEVTLDNLISVQREYPEAKVGETYTGQQGCNLTSVNVARCSTEVEFLACCRAASLIGTIQASYTTFTYSGAVTEELFKREALIGVSLTGIQDNPAIGLNSEILRKGAKVVIDTNMEIAKRLGINPSPRCCLIKPEGTGSLWLGGVSPGSGPHHARRILRLIEAHVDEKPYQHIKSVNPEMVYETKNSAFITFCIEAPAGAVVRKDKNAIDLLKDVQLLLENWVTPGQRAEQAAPSFIRHNVSNTITVRGPAYYTDEALLNINGTQQELDRLKEEGEWGIVADYIWDNREVFGGITLFSYIGDTVYENTPNQEVNTPEREAIWNRLSKSYKEVDYTKMIEDSDDTDLHGEISCAAGACTY